MSLKNFHIFFMTVAALAAVGFGVWCLSHPNYRYYAVPAFALALALPVYGVWFLRKMRILSNGKAH